MPRAAPLTLFAALRGGRVLSGQGSGSGTRFFCGLMGTSGLLAGACGFQGSPEDLRVFCLRKQRSRLLRGELLTRGDGGFGSDRVELLEWKLAFASSGTGLGS